MQYTKGRKGPTSSHDTHFEGYRFEGTPENPILKAVATLSLRNGRRTVTLMAQGRHAAALKSQLTGKQDIASKYDGRAAKQSPSRASTDRALPHGRRHNHQQMQRARSLR